MFTNDKGVEAPHHTQEKVLPDTLPHFTVKALFNDPLPVTMPFMKSHYIKHGMPWSLPYSHHIHKQNSFLQRNQNLLKNIYYDP